MENNANYYYQLIFKRLFSLAEDILNEYRNLTNLAKQNLKDSEPYKTGIQRLKKLIMEEDTCYSVIQNDNVMLGILLKKIAYFNKNAIDFIIPQNTNSQIYTRISLKLSKAISRLNSGKSIEIFSLFNKFDIFSLIHFETLLMSLIIFQNFLDKQENLVLQDLFDEALYGYSFMFPYIEEILISNDFKVPSVVYSTVDFFKTGSYVTEEDIKTFKERKSQQIKRYINKNNVNSLNYAFLLFYLKAMGNNDLNALIKRSSITAISKESLQEYFESENMQRLVRKVRLEVH